MQVSLGELARLVDGQLVGDPNLLIGHALPLQAGLPEGCITLIDKPQGLEALSTSRACAVVLPTELSSAADVAAIQVKNPHAAFENIIKRLRPTRITLRTGISPQAIIDPSVQLGADVAIAAGSVIGPGCVIGDRVRIHHGVHVMADCEIGEDSELHPSVVIYGNTRIGKRCLLHAGCVLGANGFGYRSVGGKHVLSAQLGWVDWETM